MPEISGCIEHTSVLTQILREAKEKKSDLAVLWLDLANTYGSIPHKLLDLLLQRQWKHQNAHAVSRLAAEDKQEWPARKIQSLSVSTWGLAKETWPLLVLEFPVSKIEVLERKIGACLRRWLGVPRSFSSVGLHSTGTKLQLSLKALTDEFKVTKTRLVMMKDAKVRGAKVTIRTGRKWKAEEAMKESETIL
ncbi:Hypothetical predicted protein [Mytilus galloprovincialis]|uniref:Reverse transcriptase domain-containing protein n=1 Tax=Mytilus galloprovincialis TaxID=29158 RepID=A0A8B6GUV5_MYTGA|nr:Hypothetical predicted protein [Mytilus galloprovincialis]